MTQAAQTSTEHFTALKLSRAFLDKFVQDGDPTSLLVPGEFEDTLAFTQDWDEASTAVNAALAEARS